MTITSISRDTNNNASIVRIITTDNLATVATSNYIKSQQAVINALNGGSWQWFMTDILMVAASNGNGFYSFTNSTFSSLNTIATSAGSGGVTPSQVQSSAFNYSSDTGTNGTNYVGVYNPIVAAYSNNQIFLLNAAHDNTIANPTFNAGAGAKPIILANGGVIAIGDIFTGNTLILNYNSSDDAFILINPLYSQSVGLEQTINKYNYANDTGAANAYVAASSLYPDLSGHVGTGGILVYLKVVHASTGASTFNYSNMGPINIVNLDGSSISSGQMQAGGVSELVYNGTNWILLNPFSSGGVTAAQIQNQAFTSAVDAGSANAYAITLTPAPSAYAADQLFIFRAANGNTGSSTIDVNSLGAKGIFLAGGNPLVGGEIIGGTEYIIIYNGALNAFNLINPSGGSGISNGGIASGQILVGSSSSAAVSGTYFTYDSTNHNLQHGSGNTFVGTATYLTLFGFTNNMTDGGGNGSYHSILGGNNNSITTDSGNANVICGGDHNTAAGVSSGILSGSNQTLGGPTRGCITHGHGCTIQGDYSIAGGETCFTAGSYTFAMGYHARAQNNGSFVWADNSSASTFQDSAANQFAIRAAGGFLFNTATSTTAVQIDSNSNLINFKGTSDQSYSLQAPSTGFSITIGAGVKTLILNPSGTLATGTVTMPASPIDGQEIRVCSSQIITGLTVSANSGQSIEGAPTTIGVGGGFAYIYNLSGTKWYRLY